MAARTERKKKIPGGCRAKSQDNAVLHYSAFESSIGTIYAAVDGGKAVALSFTSANEADFREELLARTSKSVSRSEAATRPVIRELKEYFRGKRKEFNISPDVSGRTRFQERVLRAAMSIPYGQTRTYAWLARRAGNPRAARAAGQVMAHNAVPIIIPCHRVIGSSGDLCGFAGGLRAFDIKRKLLEIEGVHV